MFSNLHLCENGFQKKNPWGKTHFCDKIQYSAFLIFVLRGQPHFLRQWSKDTFNLIIEKEEFDIWSNKKWQNRRFSC